MLLFFDRFARARKSLFSVFVKYQYLLVSDSPYTANPYTANPYAGRPRAEQTQESSACLQVLPVQSGLITV